MASWSLHCKVAELQEGTKCYSTNTVLMGLMMAWKGEGNFTSALTQSQSLGGS